MDKINSPCFKVIAVLQAMRYFYGKSTSVLHSAVRTAFDFTAVFVSPQARHLYRRYVINLPALVRKALCCLYLPHSHYTARVQGAG